MRSNLSDHLARKAFKNQRRVVTFFNGLLQTSNQPSGWGGRFPAVSDIL